MNEGRFNQFSMRTVCTPLDWGNLQCGMGQLETDGLAHS